MFKGIVEGKGVVVALEPSPAGRRLQIRAPEAFRETLVALGDSIAVDGCCLTVAGLDAGVAAFDVIPATLDRTSLGDLVEGSEVNLEHALRLEARIDGHLVQGHIDGVAVVVDSQRGEDGSVTVTLVPERPEDELDRGMIPRGSVALAGVSLTIARFDPPRFTVALIPTTLELTNLGALAPGTRVNVETDLIGKYVRAEIERIRPE